MCKSVERRYKHRQARKEEDRAKAFERVFNDPDVDLEEVAAQVRPPRAFITPFCVKRYLCRRQAPGPLQ